MYATYPLISQYLAGTTASGLYEAKLGREEFGGEVHVFAPAFKDADLEAVSSNYPRPHDTPLNPVSCLLFEKKTSNLFSKRPFPHAFYV